MFSPHLLCIHRSNTFSRQISGDEIDGELHNFAFIHIIRTMHLTENNSKLVIAELPSQLQTFVKMSWLLQ